MGKNLLKAVILSSLVLSGCNSCIRQDAKEVEEIRKMNIENLEKGPEMVDYLGKVPMYSESGMGLTSGDFDNDGDLDLIVGARNNNLMVEDAGSIYFFENNGKGNFKLRQYQKK